MKNLKTIFLLVILTLISNSYSFASEKLFEAAKKKFEKKDYEKSKFLFQRNIVFNPKNAESYIYLAKIFKTEENQEEEEKNLDTALLLQPDNEEAIYLLINIQIDRSNFEKVNTLMKRFSSVCKSMCNKETEISKSLQDIEAKDEKTN
ncbi:hypothetical protein N9U84_00145 [Candidatus Pelagibacter sp.]|nr:hypothetical protein [Candidatus Pelagibacter sp.]